MTDLNGEARALLSAARRSGTTIDPARKSRVRRALLASAGLSTTATAALSVGKLMVVSAVSAAIGSGATLVVTRWQALHAAPPQVKEVSSPSPRPSPETPPPAVEVGPPEPEPVTPRVALPRKPALVLPVVNAPAEDELKTPPIPASPEPQATQAVPLPDESALALELELLDQVVAAVSAQRWLDAQSGLDAHAARFPHPAFPHEASALQVRVWCAAGREEEAKALTLELKRSDPLNPAVQRLRSSCSGK